MADPNWLFLFPLRRESSSFKHRFPQAKTEIIGMGADRSAAATESVIEKHRPDAIVLAGFAGALRPDLQVGDVVVASSVLSHAPASQARLPLRTPRAPLDIARPAVMISSHEVIGDPVRKRELHHQYSADVVDMESYSVASVCERHQIPWQVVRVISDTAGTVLSPSFVRFISVGEISWHHALWAAIRNPKLIAEFRRLAIDTRIAADSLANVLSRLTPT